MTAHTLHVSNHGGGKETILGTPAVCTVTLPASHLRAVWFASLASNFGGLIESVGAAWLMTSIGTSADMVALVQASTTLPIMLFSLAAGAIADNFDRRKLMLDGSDFPAWRLGRPDRCCTISA